LDVVTRTTPCDIKDSRSLHSLVEVYQEFTENLPS